MLFSISAYLYNYVFSFCSSTLSLYIRFSLSLFVSYGLSLTLILSPLLNLNGQLWGVIGAIWSPWNSCGVTLRLNSWLPLNTPLFLYIPPFSLKIPPIIPPCLSATLHAPQFSGVLTKTVLDKLNRFSLLLWLTSQNYKHKMLWSFKNQILANPLLIISAF